MSTLAAALRPVPIPTVHLVRSDPGVQAFMLLRIAFTVAPILFGLDKFAEVLTDDWARYLSPQFNDLIPGSAEDAMYLVGVIEVVAGLVVLALPRYGSLLVAGWLGGIIVNLLLAGGYGDIALRDFGLMLGALSTVIVQYHRLATVFLWMKAVYGEEADRAWERLSGRVLTVTKGWSEAYGLFLDGEAPMVLSYTTSPAYHQVIEGTDRYKAVIVEGEDRYHYQTLMDYIHLNPVRARQVQPDKKQSVLDYEWSSLASAYALAPKRRAKWLSVEAGLKAAFALPVIIDERVVGAMEFFCRERRKPDKWMLQVAMSIGSQIGQFVERNTPHVFAPGAKKDELQSAIQLVRKSIADLPLQFINFRD